MTLVLTSLSAPTIIWGLVHIVNPSSIHSLWSLSLIKHGVISYYFIQFEVITLSIAFMFISS